MATNTSMAQGKFMRGLGMCVLLPSVVSVPHDFKSLVCFFYRVCMCRMLHSHVYKPTAWPVASCSLFLDIQEVTLLL